MKKPADFAILAIGIYVFHQIVLSAILSGSWSFFESIKYFTPIEALSADFFDKWDKVYFVLEGIINLALVGVMVFMIIARGKNSGPVQGSSAADFGTSAPTSQQ